MATHTSLNETWIPGLLHLEASVEQALARRTPCSITGRYAYHCSVWEKPKKTHVGVVTRQKGCEMYYYTDNKATRYGITCWPQAIDMHDATVMSRLATKLGIGFFSSPTSTGNLIISGWGSGQWCCRAIKVTVACRHLPSVDRGRALETSMPISDLWPTYPSLMSVEGPLH